MLPAAGPPFLAKLTASPLAALARPDHRRSPTHAHGMLHTRTERSASRPFVLAMVFLLGTTSVHAREDEQPPVLPTTSAINAAWKKAKKSARKKFPKALAAQVAELQTHQMELVREVIEGADLNLKRVPELLAAPAYDPKKHAPKLPVKRKVVKAGTSAARGAKRRMEANIPERGHQPAWAYDYGSGEVVQIVEEPDDPDRLFANALAGYAPGLDLAEALVEMSLDDGSQAKIAAAFGHAYSDRGGNCFPGITIYDAWCSGHEIEMPDVECLGIVHDVLDEWDRWQSPISGSQHRQLYAKLEEMFTDLRRYRGLRHALVRCFFNGEAILRDDYDSQLGTFQALWTTVDESPSRLASSLPGPEEWRAWLVGTAEMIDEDEDWAWDAGQERIQALTADRDALRACLVGALLDCRILKLP